MCRIVLLLALSLLLSSCVSAYLYFSVAERQYFRGIIDGAEKSDVEKYNLVYLFNGDTVSALTRFMYVDNDQYETRSSGNIDWSKMEQLVLKDENDTIYHYTVKYGDKRDKNDRHLNHSLDFDELVEVP